MTAKAREESIVYAIPIAEPFLASNMDVLNFLLENFATNTSDSKTVKFAEIQFLIRYSILTSSLKCSFSKAYHIILLH
jgi:hypothetical protein